MRTTSLKPGPVYRIALVPVAIGLVAAPGGTIFAAVPNTVVESLNTSVGHNALGQITSGTRNSAVGFLALGADSTATDNTAMGYGALVYSNGSYDTALGASSMLANTTGSNNTAVGYQSLQSNTVGGSLVAVGMNALGSNTSASNSTAVGFEALAENTTGESNTAVGYESLRSTTTGHDNTAVGNETLYANTTGQQNMAFGRNALHNNTSGSFNSAMGYSACWSCRSGSNNVAYGFKSLYSLNNGSGNIAVGSAAGYNLTGSNNIDIANAGMSGDSGVTRIGAESTQTKAYIAGIANSRVTGAPVYITSDGQLGTLASAQRYKTAIKTLRDPAENLARLRPVSFHLRSDPEGLVQYGLIAEEVATVYPELVIRDSAGTVQGVRYDELAPLLLKQVQSLQTTVAEQAKVLRAQTEELATMHEQSNRLEELAARLAALESGREPKLAAAH